MVATTDLTALKARLLDLTTGVLEMCRDGVRDINQVCAVFQIVKDDPDFAERLLDNGTAEVPTLIESLAPSAPQKVFMITTSGKKASTLIAEGRYDWTNDAVTDERFPIVPHTPVKHTIEYVEFDHDPTSEEVLAEFVRVGLKRPTYEDALEFGVGYPNEQRKRPVIFLHEPVRHPVGARCVLILDGHGCERYLRLYGFDDRWYRYCVFAGVRE